MTYGPLPESVLVSISNQLLNNKLLNLAYNNQGLFEPRVPFLKTRSESADHMAELIPAAAPLLVPFLCSNAFLLLSNTYQCSIRKEGLVYENCPV